MSLLPRMPIEDTIFTLYDQQPEEIHKLIQIYRYIRGQQSLYEGTKLHLQQFMFKNGSEYRAHEFSLLMTCNDLDHIRDVEALYLKSEQNSKILPSNLAARVLYHVTVSTNH